MKPMLKRMMTGLLLAGAAVGAWWAIAPRNPDVTASAAVSGKVEAPTAGITLRTLVRDAGEFNGQPRLSGTRIAMADPREAAAPWRPGLPFSPTCRPANVADAPGSVPYRAIEFSVSASGLYYVGADFAALAGPDNLWPRFVHSDGFDPANPAGGSCRGGGAVLYTRLTAGVRYTLVTAGWTAYGDAPRAATGAYASIVRPWVAPRGDVDADGLSELIWQDEQTGGLSITKPTTGRTIASVRHAAGERFIGTGDLDGDGAHDLLWHDPESGRTSYTPSRALPGASDTRIDVFNDPAWRPTALGDLDGDGTSDLIWTNDASGETHVWLIVAGARGATGGTRMTILTHPTWRVVAAGDLDGDFKADLLWADSASGESAYWLMDGLTRRAEGTLLRDGGWRIIATGDLNADGRQDLLWHNDGARSSVVWLMDESGRAAASQVPLLSDTDWRLIGSADIDGDARADLLWQDQASGAASAWLMAGALVRERRELARPGTARLQPGG